MTEGLPSPVFFDLRLPDLTTERGGQVSSLVVRGWMWASDGPAFLRRRGLVPREALPGQYEQVVRRAADAPSARPPADSLRTARGRDLPTILIVHALTGHAGAGGPGGWWEPVIGVGNVFDPTVHRVLCFNNLGSCYGTSGPADDGYTAGPLTTWDQARVILRALDALAIERVELATGGSLGGMITLSLAALTPARFRRIVPIAACAAASSWIIGFNHVQRRAIESSPNLGLSLARQIAMLSYRAEAGLDLRQGRRPADPGSTGAYRMQTYLDYQGTKLVNRFEVGTYLAMMDAMDNHDLTAVPQQRDEGERWSWPDSTSGLSRITASCMSIGIDTDQLFLPVHSQAVAT